MDLVEDAAGGVVGAVVLGEVLRAPAGVRGEQSSQPLALLLLQVACADASGRDRDRHARVVLLGVSAARLGPAVDVVDATCQSRVREAPPPG
ncbi:hypothetical protein AQJ64_43375 [Streptomyces griseoruber]|uniref:Uncharacterized protein n=1 Tax=Streptomyces griseoruber TaxID=1943 RepID=A0A101SJL1_9ACTN|nr:hypothetical protein AQJ64_43375 [Streptomyces griseoruber]